MGLAIWVPTRLSVRQFPAVVGAGLASAHRKTVRFICLFRRWRDRFRESYYESNEQWAALWKLPVNVLSVSTIKIWHGHAYRSGNCEIPNLHERAEAFGTGPPRTVDGRMLKCERGRSPS